MAGDFLKRTGLCAALLLLALPTADAMAGRVLVTGHDADLHCAGGGDQQCHFVRVAVDYVRATAPDATKPVLILDHDPTGSNPPQYLMEGALDRAYAGSGPPRTVIDPRSSQFAMTPLSTDNWSAIIVASDQSCGGCDLNESDIAPDSDAINARAGEFAEFFNRGGGLFFASGAARGDGDQSYLPDGYYGAVPLPLGGAQVAEPFALTDEGRALGFIDDPNDPNHPLSSDINCCATHNSFQEPPADSALRVAERDANGAPETLFGDGVIRGGTIRNGEPPPPTPDATLTLEGVATELTGGSHSVTALAARDTPLAGTPLVWRVDGPNPASGQATTGADGKAVVTWSGTKPGRDTLIAFADLNGNGARDAGEPEATHGVEWLEPPVVKKTANVEPLAGTVLIKLPAGASPARYRLGAAQAKGFIPLTQATQIPLGSTLDTTRGRVQVQSAVGITKPGQTQSGEFNAGHFQIRQTGPSTRPITEMVMNEALKCQSSKKRGKVVAAAKRSRQLWGKGKGRFRTRGRNSSATVRGTEWLTKDTCTTTTTLVKSGVVTVTDFGKRKNVTVRAGKKYVARAKRR